MLDNPIVFKDAEYAAVWTYLLLNATHREYPAIFKGKKIMLSPGQLITGRKSIATKLKISESKVERVLKWFENDQQIEQQTSNKNRLITIVNWALYQDSEQQIEHETDSFQPSNDHKTTTNKNVKNDKNEKNVRTNIYTCQTNDGQITDKCQQNDRLSKDKVSKDKISKDKYSSHFESFWKCYPRKIGKAEAYKCYQARLNDGYSEEELLQAVKNYAETCKAENREEKYIKHAKTFLGANTPFADYLKKEGDENEQNERRREAADYYRKYFT